MPPSVIASGATAAGEIHPSWAARQKFRVGLPSEADLVFDARFRFLERGPQVIFQSLLGLRQRHPDHGHGAVNPEADRPVAPDQVSPANLLDGPGLIQRQERRGAIQISRELFLNEGPGLFGRLPGHEERPVSFAEVHRP